MKKLYLLLCSLVMTVFCFAVNVFADVGGEVSKSLFEKLGGWQVVVVICCFGLIWIVRATKTKKDDEILDKYVTTAVSYALKVMPQNSKIDWVKFVGNALGNHPGSSRNGWPRMPPPYAVPDCCLRHPRDSSRRCGR